MNDYIFTNNDTYTELARLKMIEAALDPATISSLNKTGIQEGWSCLELGPGAGSIMNWMGHQVGLKGKVVAIDKNTSYVKQFVEPPYELIEGDISKLESELKFDLIHCRYVLIHNRDTNSILKKLKSLLKPGGFIVIEEPDFTSAKCLNETSSASIQRVNSAICRMFSELGLNPGYGLTIPTRILEQGFSITSTQSMLHLAAGSSPIAKMMGESTRVLSSEYIATGEADAADIKDYIKSAYASDHWMVYYATITVIATQEHV
jgi:ubiquinone/menaquinone biosynthesis C-methylase UbiE